jgi:hypothetical protein
MPSAIGGRRAVRAPGWSLVGVSVIGASHQARGVTCQDAHCYRVGHEGVAIAVADGAGSAPRSDEGAWVAVHRAAAILERALSVQQGGAAPNGVDWEDRMLNAFGEARAALETMALQERTSLRSFHCTLSCALALQDRLVVGQIGDGAIVARQTDGALRSAAEPQRGEYANEAYFLTMDGALELVQVSTTPGPVSELALITDGLIRLALNLQDGRPHAAFFDPLLAALREAEDPKRLEGRLARFLASDRVGARSDDDKTLVLAVRSDGSAEGASGASGTKARG